MPLWISLTEIGAVRKIPSFGASTCGAPIISADYSPSWSFWDAMAVSSYVLMDAMLAAPSRRFKRAPIWSRLLRMMARTSPQIEERPGAIRRNRTTRRVNERAVISNVEMARVAMTAVTRVVLDDEEVVFIITIVLAVTAMVVIVGTAIVVATIRIMIVAKRPCIFFL